MQVFALPSIVAVQGPVSDNIAHRHHALQIVAGLQGPFELMAENKVLTYRAAVVAPDVSHRLDAANCLLFLLEPESHLAVDLRERWLSGKSIADISDILSDSASDAIRGAPLTKETLSGFFSEVSSIACFRRHLEPRVKQVIIWIDGMAASGNLPGVSLSGALDIACLSESRFLHLFSEQVGIPWRRYILWRRLLGAVAHAAGGHSLTESAHFAAFADAAHFSKTFKAMFGLSPAAVIKNSRFIQAL